MRRYLTAFIKPPVQASNQGYRGMQRPIMVVMLHWCNDVTRCCIDTYERFGGPKGLKTEPAPTPLALGTYRLNPFSARAQISFFLS